MIKRFILAAAIGSVVVFLVSSVWHMASGLGQVGIAQLPNEDAVLSALRGSIPSSGLYLFPGMDAGAGQAAYRAKYRKGPTGLLVYHPGGKDLAFGKLLLVQFLTGLAGALLLAFVLAMTGEAATFRKRALVVVAVALFASVIYEIPYWNWYGFPASYILAHGAGWVVSWTAAGLAMAAILSRDREGAVYAVITGPPCE